MTAETCTTDLVGDIENYPISSPIKGRLFKPSTLGRMLLCCLVTVVLLSIMIPVTVLFIVPSVAETMMSSSQLGLESMKLYAPTNVSVLMQLATTLSKAGPVDVTMADTSMDLIYKNAVIGTFRMPSKTIKGGTENNLNITSKFLITDKKNFGLFINQVVTKENFSMQMKGSVTIKVDMLGLVIKNVPFSKELTVDGMNGFKEIELQSFDLPRNSKTGIEMIADTRMKNPSIISMEMGDPVFSLHYKDVLVAIVGAQDLTLSSGWNDITMKGDLLYIKESAIVSEFFSAYIRGEDSRVAVKGKHSLINGASVDWVDETMRFLSLETTVAGIKDLNVIDSIDIIGMTIVPIDDQVMALEASIQATYTLPFGFSSTITHMQQVVSLVPNGSLSEAVTMNVTSISCKDVARKLQTVLVGTLRVQSNFQSFISSMVNDASVSVMIQGEAMATVSTNAGVFNVNRLPVNQISVFAGMNLFKNPPVKLLSFDLPFNTDKGIRMVARGSMFNPSPVAMKMGTATFTVFYKSILIAELQVQDLLLVSGWNELSMEGDLIPVNDTLVVAQFFKNYITGKSSVITIKGESIAYYKGDTTVDIPWLNETIRMITMDVEVPGRKNFKLIQGLKIDSMSLRPIDDKSFDIFCLVVVKYAMPFDFPITITHMDQLATLSIQGGKAFGVMRVASSKVDNPSPNVMHVMMRGTLRATDNKVFDEYLVQAMTKNSSVITLTGFANTTFTSNVGIFDLIELPVNEDSMMPGMNNFQTVPPIIQQPRMVRGDVEELEMAMKVMLFNPSVVGMSGIGDCSFDLIYKEESVAKVIIRDFEIAQGENLVDVSALVYVPNNEIRNEFFAKYVQGHNLNVILQGNSNSTSTPLLSRALEELSLETFVPGLDRVKNKIILEAFIGVQRGYFNQLGSIANYLTYAPTSLSAGFTIRNPFDVVIYITGISEASVIDEAKDKAIGIVNEPVFNPVMEIQPFENVTEVSKSKFNLEFPSFELMLRLQMGKLRISVDGYVDVNIDKFKVNLKVFETNIPVHYYGGNVGRGDESGDTDDSDDDIYVPDPWM